MLLSCRTRPAALRIPLPPDCPGQLQPPTFCGRAANVSSGADWSGTGCIAPRAISNRRSGSFRCSPSCSCLRSPRCLRCARQLARAGGSSGWAEPARSRSTRRSITLDAVVPGLHVRIAAGRDPGRRRPADAADHRDDAAARQRRPITASGCSSSRSSSPSWRSTGWRRRRTRSSRSSARCWRSLCMAMFLFLIDYAARLLRPVSILARVGEEGAGGDQVGLSGAARATSPDVGSPVSTCPRRHGAVVSARRRDPSSCSPSISPRWCARRDKPTALSSACRRSAISSRTDEPLFVLYGGAVAIDDHALRATVAFGAERTMEQDPLFSFRILVDIALKALSPAINDPTTAVLALDQIHRLLRTVGQRQLRGEAILDEAGHLRVIFRTPELGRLRPRLLHRDPRLRRQTTCRSRAGCARCSTT